MSRKVRYQDDEYQNNAGERATDDDGVFELEAQKEGLESSMSSSPPKDFDVNLDTQYVPLFDFDDEESRRDGLNSSSSASALSLDTHEELNPFPVRKASISRLVRCPVCEKPMRTFYCSKCIQGGHFVTTENAPSSEILLESKSRSLNEPLPSPPEFEELDEDKIYKETLQVKFNALKKKTQALQSLYNDRKEKLTQTKASIKEERRQLDAEKKSNKAMQNKIELIKKYIDSREASVKKRHNAMGTLDEDLKQHVSRKVFQLTNDVFPIEQVNLLEQSNVFANMETSPLLTFSDGSQHQLDRQTAYSIVEPWLPSDGDYSAYSLWVNDNQDRVPAPLHDLSERNPAARIGAGLAYTTQLVKNLAHYLDVTLPANMSLGMFNKELLDDTKFTYNVAKLNANVINLCVSQGIDVSLLNPQRTLKNLLLLLNLNLSDLGRAPIFELDNEEVAKKIEERIAPDLSLIQDEFYDFTKFIDEEDISDSEWEISDPAMNALEMESTIEQSVQQDSYISRLPLRFFGSFWTGS